MTQKRLLAIGFVILVLNSGWLWAFAEPTLFYVGNVLAHIVIGLVLAVLLVTQRGLLRQMWQSNGRGAALLLGACLALGLLLCVIGATRANMWIVAVHGAAGFLAAALVVWFAWSKYPSFGRWVSAAAVVAMLLPAGEYLRLKYHPERGRERIVNPTMPPLSMDGEGEGPNGPFFPSSSRTNVGGVIPSEFFLDSKACGECHKEIYEMWNSSMHHFSSFNNQFYRKSIEYMQETAGVKASKWCAGCHDHAMFFNGRFEKPVIEQIDTEAAQAGLGCMSCHSITHVADTMGNGGFEMTYPPLHGLMTSKNELIRTMNEYVINTAPAAHRKAFMKPFMRADASEFCSTCHKVHLDVPVNDYRWFRGFNDYDAWHASGVSGYGARSFYYPAKSSSCVDCHMPLVPSKDPGNHGGQVHSHRFPGANTAVPFVNEDHQQLETVTKFLQDGIVGVDIFAVSPVVDDSNALQMLRRAGETPAMATTFASGEESAGGNAPMVLREVGEISAPINRAQPSVVPGSTVKVDVVVRTKKIGHLFPTGTVDAFDIWVELRAEDAKGRPIYWSGRVQDDGRGPVEPGAHFYQSFLLDEHGNAINKRNAFHARTVLYSRLIPPGAADTVHYRIKIPEDAVGPIKLHAKLNYRKFSHYYTQFSYAGKAVPGKGEFSKSFDDREFDFSPSNIPVNVSGKIKDRIPDLPITTLAENTAELQLGTGESKWQPAVAAEDYMRWNDFGIGLLLQGDLKGAQWAFQRVTEAKPDYADGWLNIARALIQEGETSAAWPYINKALEIDSSLGRIHFFKAMIEKAEGKYDDALASLRTVDEKYPLDRVNLNQMARILFLKRQYQEALGVLDRVARIDPEDLQLHYTAMLCYRGLGNQEKARIEEQLFERFKADEDSQVITADVRRLSPEANNERQVIHEHLSVDLPAQPSGYQSRSAASSAAGGQP